MAPSKTSKSSGRVVKRNAAIPTTTEQPPVHLLDLVEKFLSDYAFRKAHHAFQKKRKERAWVTAATQPKGLPSSLLFVYQTWETSANRTPPEKTFKDAIRKANTFNSIRADESSSSSSSSSGSDSSDPSDSDDDDVSMDDVPARVSSSSESSSSSSDSEDNAKAAKPAAIEKGPATNPLKRKASSESDSSSNSSSDSDMDSSSSDDDAPRATKRVKAKAATVSSDSSDSDSSSNADSESESDSESDSENSDHIITALRDAEVKKAAATPLPVDSDSDSSSNGSDSDSSSSSSDSELDDAKAKPAAPKAVSTSGSDISASSATVGKASPKVFPVDKFAPLPPDPMAKANNRGRNNGNAKQTTEPFSRVRKDVKVDPRLASNAFAGHEWGQKAHEDLIVTKGKGFTKEKNKKKKGSYKGGRIDTNARGGIKFDD